LNFKVDENLPREVTTLLISAGYNAVTVVEQNLGGEDDINIIDVCAKEERVLVTLDMDFADVRTYPPNLYSGLIVIRVHKQDKPHILAVFSQVIPLLIAEPLDKHLWKVEESKVRIRGGQ